MSTVILRISPRFCRGRLSPSPSDLLVPFSLLSGPFCPQQPSLSVSLLSYISFLFPLVTAGIGVKRKHIKLNLKFCRNSAFGLKLKDTQPEPAGERNLWLLLCSHYTISFGYTSLRRNLAPGFQQYMLKPVCAGIITAPRLLYQVANATANHRYVFPPLFSKKSSSFCIYVVLLSYHTKQSHIHKNCYD